MSDVEPGKAKAAGIVGIIIGVTGLVNFICGCIYTSFGPKDASGLWSGIGVSSTWFYNSLLVWLLIFY